MGRRKKGDDVSGWLALDKPEDFTSTEIPELDALLRAAGRELAKYQTPSPTLPTPDSPEPGPQGTLRLNPPLDRP